MIDEGADPFSKVSEGSPSLHRNIPDADVPSVQKTGPREVIDREGALLQLCVDRGLGDIVAKPLSITDQNLYRATLHTVPANGFPINELSPTVVLEHLESIRAAVERMHGRGIYHGDLKPEHVFLCPSTGKVTIIDFGIAYAADHETLGRASLEELGLQGYYNEYSGNSADFRERDESFLIRLEQEVQTHLTTCELPTLPGGQYQGHEYRENTLVKPLPLIPTDLNRILESVTLDFALNCVRPQMQEAMQREIGEPIVVNGEMMKAAMYAHEMSQSPMPIQDAPLALVVVARHEKDDKYNQTNIVIDTPANIHENIFHIVRAATNVQNYQFQLEIRFFPEERHIHIDIFSIGGRDDHELRGRGTGTLMLHTLRERLGEHLSDWKISSVCLSDEMGRVMEKAFDAVRVSRAAIPSDVYVDPPDLNRIWAGNI